MLFKSENYVSIDIHIVYRRLDGGAAHSCRGDMLSMRRRYARSRTCPSPLRL